MKSNEVYSKVKQMLDKYSKPEQRPILEKEIRNLMYEALRVKPKTFVQLKYSVVQNGQEVGSGSGLVLDEKRCQTFLKQIHKHYGSKGGIHLEVKQI